MPATKVTEYTEGQVIYGAESPSQNVYLVIQGMVEISRPFGSASGAVLEIIQPDELFGESAFLGMPCSAERATALGSATLMTWTIAEMEDLVGKRPELGVALLKFFARRNAELKRRIESLSLDTLERRLALALILLSPRLGTTERDGTVRMGPLTLETLSRYVGASHEIVTQYMNRFRQQGYVSHARHGISFSPGLFRRLTSHSARRSRSRRRA